MKPSCRPLLVALAVTGVNGACGSGPAAPGGVEPPSCDDRGGAAFALTDGPTTDEDGTFLLADDGTVHFAFISNRAGTMDVWMTSSRDALQWSAPRPVVATPDDDLLNVAARTRDGLYHLTGRTQFMVADSTSADLQGWTPPAPWSDPRTDGWTAGHFQEAPNGDYWLVTLSEKTGTRKLYLQRSRDRGQSWEPRLPLTAHGQADMLFSFRIARDGTFILVWEQRDARDQRAVVSSSSNIYLATSADGRAWTAPLRLSPDTGREKFDVWPALLLGPGDQYYAAWLSSRLASATAPAGTVMVPVHPRLDGGDIRAVPAPGYSVRSQRLLDGRYLLAWVQTNPTNGSSDYFYRFVCNFDFPAVRSSNAVAPAGS
jgi:hypothetical protein